MKSVILFIVLIIFPAQLFAHGYPTAEEFQMFPESIIAQPIATVGGAVVAVPFAIVGSVVGLIASPFYGPTNDTSENIMAGAVFIGLCGYMVGQQIGWPFYAIEKGIWWVTK